MFCTDLLTLSINYSYSHRRTSVEVNSKIMASLLLHRLPLSYINHNLISRTCPLKLFLALTHIMLRCLIKLLSWDSMSQSWSPLFSHVAWQMSSSWGIMINLIIQCSIRPDNPWPNLSLKNSNNKCRSQWFKCQINTVKIFKK